MRFEELEQLVIIWADDRNLILGTTALDQYRKLDEEFKELGQALTEESLTEIKDGIGDMLVVLTIICRKLGFDLFSCYATAYLEIKDRKGKMVDGLFVKEV